MQTLGVIKLIIILKDESMSFFLLLVQRGDWRKYSNT